MLSTKVKTTGDLMSIALQAEREAIRRYSELANSMREGNNDSAAALFERMVLEEQEHERLLLEWMSQEHISENPEIGPISWRDPNISTTYDEEASDPYYSTPYRALAFAVHNEEIAFRFYTHVAAESENEAVRKYAEILAREELGHAALIRAERRRAYHAERKSRAAQSELDPACIQDSSDLLAAAIHIDRHLANEMDTLAAGRPEIKSLAEQTRARVSANEAALLSHTAPNESIVGTLEKFDSYRQTLAHNITDPDRRIHQLCVDADRSFAFYDAVVATAADEDSLFLAQQMAADALDRIGVLKQLFESQFGG